MLRQSGEYRAGCEAEPSFHIATPLLAVERTVPVPPKLPPLSLAVSQRCLTVDGKNL